MYANIVEECIADVTCALWGALANAMRGADEGRIDTLTRALETLGAV